MFVPSPDLCRDCLAWRLIVTEQGGGGIIKPGDTLLFDVELLGFHEKAKERWEMSADEVMVDAVRIKVTTLYSKHIPGTPCVAAELSWDEKHHTWAVSDDTCSAIK